MFVGDQGRDYLAAKEIITSHEIALVGPQTSKPWLYLGPFFYYFLALFLWIGNFNPVWPAYGTAFFGVLAIYLIYVLGTKVFNKNVGLLAALFYAVSPFAVLQSRIALHPSIYPVFVIGFLLVLLELLKKGKFQALDCLLLATFFLISIQLHLSAILMVPIAVLSWEKIKLKKSIFLKIFLGGTLLLVFWKISRDSPFTSISFWWKVFEQIFNYGNIFGAILALLITAFGVIRLGKAKEIGAKVLLLSLLVIVCGLTVKNSTGHYFNLFLPVIILIFAYGLNQIFKMKSGKLIVFLAGLFFLISNCYFLISSNYFSRIYGPGLVKRIKLARFISDDSSGQPFVLKRCGPLWDYPSTNMNYEYLVWWLKRDKGEKWDRGETVYYIFEPKKALRTMEGCWHVKLDKGESFEFEQAVVVKI